MQQERHGPGAPPKNDNASNRRKGLRIDGYYTKFFTNAKLANEIVDKLAIELGHEPSIEEIRAKSKEIYFNGLSEYLEN